jgi:hypothetical protein
LGTIQEWNCAQIQPKNEKKKIKNGGFKGKMGFRVGWGQNGKSGILGGYGGEWPVVMSWWWGR